MVFRKTNLKPYLLGVAVKYVKGEFTKIDAFWDTIWRLMIFVGKIF